MKPYSKTFEDIRAIYTDPVILDEEFLIFENPIHPYERYINACAIIPRIVSAYNQAKLPDWDNYEQRKYLPVFKKVGSAWVFDDGFFWDAVSNGPSAHHYLNETHLKEACERFKDIYVDYFSYTG